MKRYLLFFIAAFCVLTAGGRERIAPKPATALRLMSYNIRNCRGMDNVTDIDRVAQVITDAVPDVVAVQEVDSAARRTQGLDMLGEVAARTGMHPVFGPSIDYQGGKYGVGVLSRHKPISHRRISLPGREEARSLLIVEFDNYYICSTHLTLTDEDQEQSADIIIEELRSLDSKKRVYLLGDMNMLPDSKVVTKLLKHFYLLSDPAQHTFPADKPQSTIDYIYCLRRGRRPDIMNYIVMAGRLASDHLPIFVDVKR